MLVHAGVFLLDALTGFFTALLLLRFYMQLFRVPFGNQIGAFVLQLTNWLVKPSRKIFPGIFGLDLASLLSAYFLQLVLLCTVFLLRSTFEIQALDHLLVTLLWKSALATLRVSIHLLVGALVLQAVLSWINPHSPLNPLVTQLTRPFLRPIRRFVPPIANIDLSPLIAILLAQLALIFL